MKKEKILIIIIILIVIIGAIGGFFILANSTFWRKRIGFQEEFIERATGGHQVITINSKGFEEVPKEMTVKKGGEIWFFNKDTQVHTLVREIDDKTPSIEMKPLSMLRFLAESSGQFIFYLKQQPEAKIKIIVKQPE